MSMSANDDAALVYQRTEAGEDLLRAGASALGIVARRILPYFDGRRRVADLPDSSRPGDLGAAITELQTRGLIRFTGRSEAPDEAELLAQQKVDHIALNKIKADLAGAFSRELGNSGAVWDARINDCVSLVVLRRVLREAIDVAYFRAGAVSARRLVDIVRPVFRAHKSD